MTKRTSLMTSILFIALASGCASTTVPSRTATAAAEAPSHSPDFSDSRHAPAARSAIPDPSSCGHDWSLLVDPFFSAAGANGDRATAVVGHGCRSTSTVGDTTISVLVEPVSIDVIIDVPEARRDNSALMGFVELDFVATDARVASSLHHPDSDRLVENRWLQLDATSAMRLEVTMSAGGRLQRDDLLPHITALEASAANYLHTANTARHISVTEQASNIDVETVSQALDVVVQRVADSLVLESLATRSGTDAIAFEYAFPDNFVALASKRRADDCTVEGTTAVCDLNTAGDRYRFTFALVDDHWLLDDFTVTPQISPSVSDQD